jgi:Flp pilus assembly pilin Flp
METPDEPNKEGKEAMVAMIDNGLMWAMTAVAGLRARLTEERGQDLLEYALLGGLIAAAITGATVAVIMTGALDSMASGIADCIDFDGTTPCP